MPLHENAARTFAQDEAKDAVWAGIARGYAAFGSPLVPGREDIDIVERAVATHASGREAGGLHAVLLGVTPGIALMQWPLGSMLTAVDGSAAVIGALWPGDIANVRQAVCASWLDIPKERKSCDVVIGDGSLNVCRFPAEVRELCRASHDLLKADGILVVRCYVRPTVAESVDAVMHALFSAEGLGVDPFKMRLWLAMQRSVKEGVAVREAARVLERYGIDGRVMKEQLGWSDAAIEPFASWRTSDAVYSFPSLSELREVMSGCFSEVSVTYPSYALGDCCPTVVMRVAGGFSS